jgi:hypothetical protein
MWAVGCIFYELVLRQRIFEDDWQVIQYASLGRGSDEIVIGADRVPDEPEREFIVKVIKELLHVDPTRRPRAKDLCERFISWGSDSSAKQVSTVRRSATNARDPELESLELSGSRPQPLPFITSSEAAPTRPVDYAPPSTDEADISPVLPNTLPETGCMDTQIKYSKYLFASNYGIALQKPSYINVGDLCFWDDEGRAVRILNIFDNQQVCLSRATSC